MRSLPILKYDFTLARKYGVVGSPIEDLQRQGFNVTNYERLRIGKCAIIEVSRLKQLKNYMTLLEPCWEFDYKYPI